MVFILYVCSRPPSASPTFFIYTRHINLIPFSDKYWYFIHQRDLPVNVVAKFYKDVIGNILLFVPLPFF